jgi:PAS domain-containing protein
METIQKDYHETNTVTDAITQAANTDLIEEAPAMILSDDGTITNCNVACATLLGCPMTEIVWQHISKFLPQIQEEMLFKEHHLNPRLRFLSRIGHHFQAVRCNGALFASKVFFVELGNTCESFIRVIIRPVELEITYS